MHSRRETRLLLVVRVTRLLLVVRETRLLLVVWEIACYWSLGISELALYWLSWSHGDFKVRKKNLHALVMLLISEF
ncbi:UNVERIFIED_CONTAM: hypothetical protein NCL1_26456 [Trichonephila clavipes]